jgi:isopenicillin N synthase-like dioxygenase
MSLSLPCISIHAPVQELAECIERSGGVLLIKDLPEAPFQQIQDLLQNSSTVTNRLNQACPNNLIYKDSSHAARNRASRVDRKASLDLSPERLASIAKVDPEVVEAEALKQPLSFYDAFKETVAEKLIPAFSEVIGSGDMLDDVAFSFRMLDYYPSPDENKATAPRLAEHRDFGFITMIQSTHPGLQVRIGNKWQDLPPIPNGTAIMMGGWCAKLRTNGRIPATLHRVTKHHDTEASRIAAVLFANPKRVDTALEPVVRSGEAQKYISGVKASDLQQRLVESKSEKYVDHWLEVRRPTKFLSRFRRTTLSAS